MYFIFAAFLAGALVGWLISIAHIRSLKEQIEVYQYYVHNRIDGQSRREFGAGVIASPLPPD